MSEKLSMEHIRHIVCNRIATEPGARLSPNDGKYIFRVFFASLGIDHKKKLALIRDTVKLVQIVEHQDTGGWHDVELTDERMTRIHTLGDLFIFIAGTFEADPFALSKKASTS